MSDHLIIRLLNPRFDKGLPQDELWADFSLFDESDHVVAGPERMALSSIASNINPQLSKDDNHSPIEPRITVLVPGEQVLLTSAILPSQQTRHVKQALPFMVEEQITEDIENMHLAVGSKLGSRDSGYEFAVAAVSHHQMEKWTSALRDAKLIPDQLIPEPVCIPYQAKGCSVLLDQHKAVIRTQQHAGLCVTQASLATTLDFIVEAESVADQDYAITVIDDDTNESTHLLYSNIETGLAEQESVSIQRKTVDASAFEQQCHEVLTNSLAVDLLQGQYVFRKKRKSHINWRPFAILLVAWFALQVTFDLSTGIYFSVNANSFDQQSKALYKEIFPDARNIKYPKRQAEGQLSNLRSNSSESQFLTLLNKSLLPISKLKQSIELQNINYSEQRNSLKLEMYVDSFNSLDTYKAELIKQQLTVSISNTKQEGPQRIRVLMEVEN